MQLFFDWPLSCLAFNPLFPSDIQPVLKVRQALIVKDHFCGLLSKFLQSFRVDLTPSCVKAFGHLRCYRSHTCGERLIAWLLLGLTVKQITYDWQILLPHNDWLIQLRFFGRRLDLSGRWLVHSPRDYPCLLLVFVGFRRRRGQGLIETWPLTRPHSGFINRLGLGSQML
jgi:hypothetical protein